MPNLMEKIESTFKASDLYTVLGASKNATQQELKKAYHRRALAYHPDRVGETEKEDAKVKFQIIGQVYEILSNEEKRRDYDETGYIDEESSTLDSDRDWSDYWRLLFPKVTQKDIEEFAEKYRGSEEELSDLKAAYLASEGDMEAILEQVLCCTFEDESRFTEILKDMISAGEVPDYDKFSKENLKSKKARHQAAKREAKEAEEAAKKLKLGAGMSGLEAAIAQRQASRAAQADDFLSQLEAKYGGAGKKKAGKKGKK